MIARSCKRGISFPNGIEGGTLVASKTVLGPENLIKMRVEYMNVVNLMY